MRRYLLLAALSLLAACLPVASQPPASTASCPSASASAAPMAAPIDRSFPRTLAETSNFRNGTPRAITITPDDSAVLFLRSAGPRERKQSLYELDVAGGKLKTLLTPEDISKADEALSAEERARRERLRIRAKGFTSYELSHDGSTVITQLSDEVVVLKRKEAVSRTLPAAKGAYDPRLSPDGKLLAFSLKGELHVAPLDGGARRTLTAGSTDDIHHGVADFIAAEELDRSRGFWWSPDNAHVLYEEVDERGVEHTVTFDPSKPETPPEKVAYPRAGTPNAKLRFGIVAVPAIAANPALPGWKPPPTTWVKWDDLKYPYVAQVVWSKGGAPLMVVLDRAQRDLALLSIDIKTGVTTTVLTEHDETWIDIDPSLPKVLSTGEIVWSSERDGNWSVELRDYKGSKLRTLLPAMPGYESVVDVDESSKTLTASVAFTPSRMGLTRVPLAGGAVAKVEGLLPVTAAQLGDGHKLMVTYEASLSTRRWALRKPDGSVVGELPSVAETPPLKLDVELMTLGADEMAAAIVRPHDPKPGALPVIDDAYGGPHGREVLEDASRYWRAQWIADTTGAAVVYIDAKGTPLRGHTWSRAIRNAFGTVPLDGHVQALSALFSRDAHFDRSRVGAFGWSFGGYFAANAVLRKPDIYRTAVAVAPVADWRLYDTAYTERYLGDPTANAAIYDAASLIPLASKPPSAEAPARSLLLIHGTADDNVLFAHGLRLAGALTLAGRPFRFLPIAGATHQVADPKDAEALWVAVVEHFRATL